MRDARNAAAFTAWVKSATGWQVEVISGLEEGRLIHLGIATHGPGARGRCVLIDLGGGSCEVTLSDRAGTIRRDGEHAAASVRVRLQQEFLRTDPPEKQDVARLRQFIDRELKKAERKLGVPRVVRLVIATSCVPRCRAGVRRARRWRRSRRHMVKCDGRKAAGPA